MLIASTSAWPTSMSASALKRSSRCSSASGTVLNDVMTKVVLIAATTSGNCGASKKRPSGIATAQDATRLASPNSTARPLSWLICATLSSRTASTAVPRPNSARSEEHTSELQSRSDLVCRLLLEKKKKKRLPRPASLLHHDKAQELASKVQHTVAAGASKLVREGELDEVRTEQGRPQRDLHRRRD